VVQSESPRCPRCGAAHEPQQEYCLECGARLPDGKPGRGRSWIRPALFFLAVSGIATAIAVAISADGSGSSSAAPPTATAAPPPATITDTVTTPPTATTAPTAPTTTSAPKPTPKPKPPARGALTTWPVGRSGYTVVLESIPASAGAALPLAQARAAQRRGVRQVGVLLSSRYPSLHPGYAVVFSGVYRTSAAATAALPAVHAKGFPGAYQARVASG